MNDYKFLPDETVLSSMLNTFSQHKTTCKMIRLAITLGGVIAGGAAISLLEAQTKGTARAQIRYGMWRDIDLWFPNQETLDVYIATAALDSSISFSPSFGRNAIDFTITDGGPQIQVIAFRTGDAVKIISQFDFTNCAVAFDGKGFWYHKDVPALSEQKKLGLLNGDSPFFMSRVAKYIKKGYYTVDDAIQERLYNELGVMADKGIALGKEFALDTSKPLSEFDREYHPTFKAICRAESYLSRFTRSPRRRWDDESTADTVFTSIQLNDLRTKEMALGEMRSSYGEARKKAYNLPYGYTGSTSDSPAPGIDGLLGLC